MIFEIYDLIQNVFKHLRYDFFKSPPPPQVLIRPVPIFPEAQRESPFLIFFIFRAKHLFAANFSARKYIGILVS